MRSHYSIQIIFCVITFGFYFQSIAKSDFEFSDVWSRDGIRYRHLYFNYQLDLPTEVEWSIGAVVQKQIEYNKELEYQQLAISATGKYQFNNEFHQLVIQGGLFPASIHASVFPLNTLGLKAGGFSVTELYQFYPRHDLYVQAKNFWLSDNNIKKLLNVGYQYRCELLDWCRIGFRIEDTRMTLTQSEYWSPEVNIAAGPFVDLGYKMNSGHIIGLSLQTQQIQENSHNGSSSSASLSLTKYHDGLQSWRASLQEGRSKTELNEWQGTEFHLEYLFD